MAFKFALRFSLFALLALPAGCSMPTTESPTSDPTVLSPAYKTAQPVTITDGSFLLSFRSAEQSAWSTGSGTNLRIIDGLDDEFPVGRMLTVSPLQEWSDVSGAGVWYTLPASVAQNLVGQRVHMGIRAQAREANTPVKFAVSASHSGQDVPWKVFTTSNDTKTHVYEFDFPATSKDTETQAGPASIHIWPDTEGTGKSIEVEYITIRQIGQLSQPLPTQNTQAQDKSSSGSAILAKMSKKLADMSKIVKDGHLTYLFDTQQIADWRVSKNSTLSLSIDPQIGTGVGRVNADAPAPLRRRGEMGVHRQIDETSAAAMSGARVRVTIEARKAAGSANVGFGVSLRNQQDSTRWHFFQPTDTYRTFTFETLFPGRKDGGGDQAAVAIWGDALGRNQFVLIKSVKIELLEDLEAQQASHEPDSEADIMLLKSDTLAGGHIKARGVKISTGNSDRSHSNQSVHNTQQPLSGHASTKMPATVSSLNLISTASRKPGAFLTKNEYKGSHILHLASYFSQRHALRGWNVLLRRHPDVLSGETPILTEAQINGKNYIRLSISALDQIEAKQLCRIIQATGDYCLVIPK